MENPWEKNHHVPLSNRSASQKHRWKLIFGCRRHRFGATNINQFAKHSPIRQDYPLVNQHSNGKSPVFNGKIHYFNWAIFHCYVSSPEGTQNTCLTPACCFNSSHDFPLLSQLFMRNLGVLTTKLTKSPLFLRKLPFGGFLRWGVPQIIHFWFGFSMK